MTVQLSRQSESFPESVITRVDPFLPPIHVSVNVPVSVVTDDLLYPSPGIPFRLGSGGTVGAGGREGVGVGVCVGEGTMSVPARLAICVSSSPNASACLLNS